MCFQIGYPQNIILEMVEHGESRKLKNKELRNLYRSSNNARLIKSRKFAWKVMKLD